MSFTYLVGSSLRQLAANGTTDQPGGLTTDQWIAIGGPGPVVGAIALGITLFLCIKKQCCCFRPKNAANGANLPPPTPAPASGSSTASQSLSANGGNLTVAPNIKGCCNWLRLEPVTGDTSSKGGTLTVRTPYPTSQAPSPAPSTPMVSGTTSSSHTALSPTIPANTGLPQQSSMPPQPVSTTLPPSLASEGITPSLGSANPLASSSSSSNRPSVASSSFPAVPVSSVVPHLPIIVNGDSYTFRGHAEQRIYEKKQGKQQENTLSYDFMVHIERNEAGHIVNVEAQGSFAGQKLYLKPFFGDESMEERAVANLERFYSNPSIYLKVGGGHERKGGEIERMQALWQKASEAGAFSLAFGIFEEHHQGVEEDPIGYVAIDQLGREDPSSSLTTKDKIIADATIADPVLIIDPRKQQQGYGTMAAVLAFGPVMSLLYKCGCTHSLYRYNSSVTKNTEKGTCMDFQPTCKNDNESSHKIIEKLMGERRFKERKELQEVKNKLVYSCSLGELVDDFFSSLRRDLIMTNERTGKTSQIHLSSVPPIDVVACNGMSLTNSVCFTASSSSSTTASLPPTTAPSLTTEELGLSSEQLAEDPLNRVSVLREQQRIQSTIKGGFSEAVHRQTAEEISKAEELLQQRRSSSSAHSTSTTTSVVPSLAIASHSTTTSSPSRTLLKSPFPEKMQKNIKDFFANILTRLLTKEVSNPPQIYNRVKLVLMEAERALGTEVLKKVLLNNIRIPAVSCAPNHSGGTLQALVRDRCFGGSERAEELYSWVQGLLNNQTAPAESLQQFSPSTMESLTQQLLDKNTGLDESISEGNWAPAIRAALSTIAPSSTNMVAAPSLSSAPSNFFATPGSGSSSSASVTTAARSSAPSSSSTIPVASSPPILSPTL